MESVNGYIEDGDLDDFSDGSLVDFRRKHGDAKDDANMMLGLVSSGKKKVQLVNEDSSDEVNAGNAKSKRNNLKGSKNNNKRDNNNNNNNNNNNGSGYTSS